MGESLGRETGEQAEKRLREEQKKRDEEAREKYEKLQREHEELEEWLREEKNRKAKKDAGKEGEGEEGEGDQQPGGLPPIPDKDDMGPVHSVFHRVLKYLSLGENVALIGPAGSGKTRSVMKAGEVLGLRYYSTGAVFAKHELLGFLDARSERVATAMYHWAKDPNGGVFNLDEMDGSLPKALTPIHELLDNRVVFFPGGERIELTDRHLIVACMNTFGRGADRVYAARAVLDGATLDRFVQVDYDYDTEFERRVFGWDIDDKKTASRQRWIQEVEDYREAVARLKGGLQHIISMRATRRGMAHIEGGIPLSKEDKHTYLFPSLDEGQVRKLQDTVKTIKAERKAAAEAAEAEAAAAAAGGQQ